VDDSSLPQLSARLRGSEAPSSLAAESLWRLAECPQEGTPHPLRVTESGFDSDVLNPMATLSQHESRRFEPEALDRSGWRFTGFRTESSAELPRAKVRNIGKALDSQGHMQIAPCMVQSDLDPV
jgi:hypothetical protein